MSHKGYGHESEIENYFLSFTGQTKKDSILKADDKGLIRLNRTFRVPTSGAMDSMKGDIITAIPWLPKQFKVECKSRRQSTKKDGRIIMIEKEWVTKNEQEAEQDNQVSILNFSFKGAPKHRLWWVVGMDDFIEHLACVFFHDTIPETQSGFEGRKLQIADSMTTIQVKQNKSYKFIWSDLIKDEKPSFYRFTDKKTKNDYVIISHQCFSFFMEQLKERG